jgi:ABC-2 type transport system permease protein
MGLTVNGTSPELRPAIEVRGLVKDYGGVRAVKGQMIVMPMFFISGALFSVASLPTWLEILNRIDPLTYAVDPMRRLVFDHLSISPAAKAALDPGVTWWGWHVPAVLEAAVILILGLIMLSIAIWEFSTTE